MADKTVKISNLDESSSFRVIYDMARSLWIEKHGKPPSMEDAEFLVLTRLCANTLNNSGTVETIRKHVVEMNK